MPFSEYVSVVLPYCWLIIVLPVESLLLQKFGDCINVDEVDYAEYVFSFSAWNTFAIWEKFAAFVINIISVLHDARCTS